MTSASESLPSDLAGAHAMILVERAARVEAERKLVDARAEAANAQADLSSTQALISYLKLEIEKLRRQLYGTRSERKARLLEQMELQLEELEAMATEDELSAEQAAAQTQTVKSFQRKRPSRKPFPAHLPRERKGIAQREGKHGIDDTARADTSAHRSRPSWSVCGARTPRSGADRSSSGRLGCRTRNFESRRAPAALSGNADCGSNGGGQ